MSLAIIYSGTVTQVQAPTCSHFWLEMLAKAGRIVAICKHCRSRGEFGMDEWAMLGIHAMALNKPVRL